jgi:hypothetical protein
MKHPRAGQYRPVGVIYLELLFAQAWSSPSYRLIGWLGMMVEIACLYTSCD